MILRICASLVALFLGVMWLRAADAPSPATNSTTAPANAAVVDLRIVHDPQLGIGPQAGIDVVVKLALPDTTIVAFDAKASKVISLTDDKGNELVNLGHDGFRGGWNDQFPTQVLADHSACLATLHGGKFPAAGATRLHLQAEAVVKKAGKETTVEQKGLRLKEGGVITVGPVPMTITNVEQRNVGDYVDTVVTLRSESAVDLVKSIEFVAADGVDIKTQQAGYALTSKNDKPIYDRMYSLKDATEEVTVRITYFDDIQAVTIPIDLEFGVGF